jgi:hypothetical protein
MELAAQPVQQPLAAPRVFLAAQQLQDAAQAELERPAVVGAA